MAAQAKAQEVARMAAEAEAAHLAPALYRGFWHARQEKCPSSGLG